MALSSDAEEILVLAQHLAPDEKLELAARLIAEAQDYARDSTTIENGHHAQGVSAVDNFDFATLPLVGIWSDREDMRDPVEWVRTIRKREWGGQE